jgi:hypothetical protein
MSNYRAACLPCNSSLGATLGNRARSTHPFFKSDPLRVPPLLVSLPEQGDTLRSSSLWTT